MVNEIHCLSAKQQQQKKQKKQKQTTVSQQKRMRTMNSFDIQDGMVTCGAPTRFQLMECHKYFFVPVNQCYHNH